jgi:methylmalonyl-CoA mutase N-terminal domain/subunit
VTDTVDPFAGSYFVETLTDEIEARANTLIAEVDRQGGALAAVPFITASIDESAWSYQERYRTEQDIVVGVNRYVEDDIPVPGTLRVDPASERDQLERLAAFKRDRDGDLVAQRLDVLRDSARGSANLLTPIREALRDHATLGEVCGAMRAVFGSHQPH